MLTKDRKNTRGGGSSKNYGTVLEYFLPNKKSGRKIMFLSVVLNLTMPVPKKKRSKSKAAKRYNAGWVATAHQKAAVALQLARQSLKRAANQENVNTTPET
jgi:ribosomal protein L32